MYFGRERFIDGIKDEYNDIVPMVNKITEPFITYLRIKKNGYISYTIFLGVVLISCFGIGIVRIGIETVGVDIIIIIIIIGFNNHHTICIPV